MLTVSQLASMGGKARARALSEERRREIANKAAAASLAARGLKPKTSLQEMAGRAGSPPTSIMATKDPTKKRAEPRAGSKNARLLEVIRSEKSNTGLSSELWSHWSGMTVTETSRALVALRDMGHVVSEGKRHAMLWRLAP